ncbi:MAG: acylphosphatase [Verrucomicrobia bacterium]|nr:acylphosphatase [Verrucomicrobiota bacterium]MBI3870472.1 acylphosphatase [Verrucomicrobiota bacterium]
MFSSRRDSVRVFYAGNVQGVGFRHAAKTVARGYEVTGTVRNLPDGRVELIAEGSEEELSSFLQAIRDSGLGPCIRHEEIARGAANGRLKGFEIVR